MSASRLDRTLHSCKGLAVYYEQFSLNERGQADVKESTGLLDPDPEVSLSSGLCVFFSETVP